MYEVTMQELGVFVVLGFFCGVFASIYISRFLEVIHAWRMVQETIVSILWMCNKMNEDLAFLSEVKRKHMRQADFTPEQIRKFEEVDNMFLTNWRDTVIISIVKRAPRHFRSMLPFTDWNEAMRFMKDALRGE